MSIPNSKIEEIHTFEKNIDYISFRESSFFTYNKWISLFGAFNFTIFYGLDLLLDLPNLASILFTRLGVSFYLLILFLLLKTKKNTRMLNNIICFCIFYGASLGSSVIVLLGGGFTIPYWSFLIYIYIPWFLLVPYSYKRKFFHALIFSILQLIILFLFSKENYILKEVYIYCFFLFTFIIIFTIFSIVIDTTYINIYKLTVNLKLEREKSEGLLLNILPKTISEQLKKSKGLISSSHEDVSIIFADIVGFTELSKNLDSERLVYILNEIFSDFDRLAIVHRIEKIKIIGDSYMAVSGAPDDNQNHVDDALSFAKAIFYSFKDINEKLNLKLKIRIGVHRGSVVSGVIGFTKFAYDLWSVSVNFASRLESSCLPDHIHVSKSFLEKVTDKEGFFLSEATYLKGIGIIDTYLLNPRSIKNTK